MPDRNAERVLILAPTGRDGRASADVLRRAGIDGRVCADFDALFDELLRGAAAVFVAEEALGADAQARLADWVRQQPPWSDLPFVVLTSRHDKPHVAAWRQHLVTVLRNVSLLERPVQSVTLSSTLLAALRARRRQYEVRALLEARDRAAQHLQRRITEATHELREQMAERARVEDSLRHAQKVEAIGQLTGGIAHDFNNLLTAVTSSLELLRKRLPASDERARDLLENALSGAERGAKLTQRMLAFARRQELRIEAVDLATLIEGMMGLLERSLGPAITIRTAVPLHLPPISTDANQLEAALLNLAVNARDAMPDGGEIVVAAREIAGGDEDGLKPGDYIGVRVTDTGHGMDRETQSRAIEPFFTTKGIGKGTGLGLSMVQGLSEQSGGRLRIDSEVGRGTTIEIVLPVAAANAKRPPGLAGAAVAQRLTRARRREVVLLVDDDELVLRSTSALLEDLGFAVIEASNGAAALDDIARLAQIDLVITDQAMPGMTGLQLAQKIHEARPQLQVILATGFAELPDELPVPVRRLAKPYRRDDLEGAIAAALKAPAAAPARVAVRSVCD